MTGSDNPNAGTRPQQLAHELERAQMLIAWEEQGVIDRIVERRALQAERVRRSRSGRLLDQNGSRIGLRHQAIQRLVSKANGNQKISASAEELASVKSCQSVEVKRSKHLQRASAVYLLPTIIGASASYKRSDYIA
jgi:hypothetical protein